MLLQCDFSPGLPLWEKLTTKNNISEAHGIPELFLQILWVPLGFTEYVSTGGSFFFFFFFFPTQKPLFLLFLHFRNKISQTPELHRACSHRRGSSAIKHRSRDLAVLPVSFQQVDKEKKKHRKSVLTELCIMEPSLRNSSSTPSRVAAG